MTRFLLITVLLSLTFFPAFSQPKNEAPIKTEVQQKLYLPAALLDDQAALAKAIPQIAKQVLVSLPKKGTSYYRQAATYYLLSGEYKDASDAIDSVRKAEEGPAWRIYFKTYAQAKIKDDTEGDLFRQVFQKEFSSAFNKLSFDQKVYEAGVDSQYIKDLNNGYKDAIEELKKNKSDSISLKDAKKFCLYYKDYLVYNKIFTLALPYINDPKYKTSFPAIKGNSWGGVIPVGDIDEIPDPKQQYKFVMELTSFAMKDDSAAYKDINLALRDIARTINLHVGAGIPKENIDIVLAVHGQALNAFLTNEKYKKKFDIDNPNIPLLKELQDFGVKIILCGQAMHYQRLMRENIIPGVKVSLTAQTVVSSYQLKNYVYSDLKLD
jgi:intracellular sulfur oxidation DsrE/DsrF family protein